MITGINHVTLSVGNVEASFRFYTEVLGFRPVAKWPRGAYLLAGDAWIAILVDEHVREGMLPEYTHVAFTASPSDFEEMSRRIQASETRIWQENRSEGASLYFADPDGHKLEIHASDLRARISAAKEHPWEGMEFFA
jgi:glutathione S-transferase fosA5